MTSPAVLSAWRFIESPPLSGEANMRYDERTCEAVAAERAPATFRLFCFSEPTLSYGRLQNKDDVKKKNPHHLPMVQRPTAGGMVFHKNDLCLSLCWKPGTFPLPKSACEVYGWVHRVILSALEPVAALRLAACADIPPSKTPFDERQCFSEPVGHDILIGAKKVVGGALAVRKDVYLYQGSIQDLPANDSAQRIQAAFAAILEKSARARG